MLTVVMLDVSILSIIMLNVIKLSVVMLDVFILIVMLSVVEPIEHMLGSFFSAHSKLDRFPHLNSHTLA